MEAQELIYTIREIETGIIPDSIKDLYKFSLDNKNFDKNLDFRIEITEELLQDFSNIDLPLIRDLFDEEIKCDYSTQRHDNLYQLCYYLYEIGDLNDIYRIYNAKFNTRNMDTGIMLDREMMYLSHEIDEVIEFVKNEFIIKPELELNNPDLLETLENLKENPDCSLNEYSKFIKGYFFGHEN